MQGREDAEEDQHHVSDHLILCILLSGALLELLLFLHDSGSETLQLGAAAVCQPSEGTHLLAESLLK